MENKFERELTKDVLVSNEHNRENINAKMNYDLSLLTKEVFEDVRPVSCITGPAVRQSHGLYPVRAGFIFLCRRFAIFPQSQGESRDRG